MNGKLTYKGYVGSIDYTPEDGVLFGKVLGIKGLISYEGVSITDINKDFEEAIDDYLEMCADKGYEPQKPVIVNDNVQLSATA